jgi:hypothetical protein
MSVQSRRICDKFPTIRIAHIHVGMGSYQVAGLESFATGWSAVGHTAGTEEEMPLSRAL